MGKFSGAGRGPAGVSEAQAEAIAGSPVADLQDQTPQAASPEADRLSRIIAQQQEGISPPPASPVETSPELQAGLTAGVEATQGLEAEQERNFIPDLRTRFLDEGRIDKYERMKTRDKLPSDDGGLFQRAKDLQTAVTDGDLEISKQLSADEWANLRAGTTVVQQATTTLPNILSGLGAQRNSINPETGRQQTDYDPSFWSVASVVTENFMADTLVGEGESDAELQKNLGPGHFDHIDEEGERQAVIKKAQGNDRLGKQIAREYQRIQRRQGIEQGPEITHEQATVLGDALKEAWAQQNPGIVNRITEGGEKSQVYYQLTPEGADKLAMGTAARKRMFPKHHVRPAKQATPGGALVGDVGKERKRETGTVEKGRRGKIPEAMENLNSIPNVVDMQRNRILLATAIPVLMDQTNNPLYDTFAEINNVGESKARKFAAAEAKAQQVGEPYNAAEELSKLKDNLAQSIYGIAAERKGANHLTYYSMAYNGRLAPQQTHFDPTSSKAVRFVTRNATPSKVEPGGRVEKNIRQMYAMMLVKGADTRSPAERDRMLRAASPQLIKWGRRLQEVLDASITPEQAEAVSQAIEQGLPLTDPNFPQVGGLQLDPEADAELIKMIKSKGEDGPHFIDGLIDFKNYAERVLQKGQPYHSYFNAYIDGKTNGLASNGIQMGSEQVARTTGVLRDQDMDLLDEGDIRDQLKEILLEGIKTNGIDGVKPEHSANYNDIAEAVFSWRDLNKATTMTFGYGAEMASFAGKIEETMGELYQIARSGDAELIAKHGLETFADSMDLIRSETSGVDNVDRHIAETLLNPYAAALEGVLSKEGVASRALMKGAATVAALTGEPLRIKSYSGMDLVYGGQVTEGIIDTQSYQIGGQKRQAHQYGSRATAAAPKLVGGEAQIGRKAIGGSVPGPVQSLDAETIALSVTGKSWDRLKKASGGNPYFHSIYDAIKMDANGYDVVLEEVNNNWLKASSQWSYLKEMYEATKKNNEQFRKDMAELGNEPVDVSPTGKYAMAGYLFQLSGSQANPDQETVPRNLHQALKQTMQKDSGETQQDFEERVWTAAYQIKDKINFDQLHKTSNVPATKVLQLYNEIGARNNLSYRFQAMIEKTDKNKKELLSKIRKQQRKGEAWQVFQYYAH